MTEQLGYISLDVVCRILDILSENGPLKEDKALS
jgi:hypothetical protein